MLKVYDIYKRSLKIPKV